MHLFWEERRYEAHVWKIYSPLNLYPWVRPMLAASRSEHEWANDGESYTAVCWFLFKNIMYWVMNKTGFFHVVGPRFMEIGKGTSPCKRKTKKEEKKYNWLFSFFFFRHWRYKLHVDHPNWWAVIAYSELIFVIFAKNKNISHSFCCCFSSSKVDYKVSITIISRDDTHSLIFIKLIENIIYHILSLLSNQRFHH